MNMRFDPRHTIHYRDRTHAETNPIIFSKTRVCKVCRKPRSPGQYRTAEATICNTCRGGRP